MALILPHVRAEKDKAYEDGIVLLLECNFKYSEIGIFGSYAREDYGPDSDVDFCMIFESEDDLPKRCDVAQLRGKLDGVGCDLIGTIRERFNEDQTLFYRNLRKDYRRCLDGKKL